MKRVRLHVILRDILGINFGDRSGRRNKNPSRPINLRQRRQWSTDKGATSMLTRTRIVLSVAITFGTACAALAAGQHASPRHGGPTVVQRQASSGADESYRLVQPPDQSTRATAVYFDPNPTPFEAFIYCASVQLGLSASRKGLKGEFRFPVFSAAPNISVQIISSAAAPPTHVSAIKVAEISAMSGPVETQIVVEAETIFDVAAHGIFYANIVVTGIPVTPPSKAKSASAPVRELVESRKSVVGPR